jgi:hypothetical protein
MLEQLTDPFLDWRERRHLRRLEKRLNRKYAPAQRGADAGARPGAAPLATASATELAVEAHIRELCEHRRNRAHRQIRPHSKILAQARFSENETSFAAVLREQGGRTERTVAEARGAFHEGYRRVRAAAAELTRFAAANDCSENEDYSRDSRFLYASGGAFILFEAVAGAGLFGEASGGGILEAAALGASIGFGNVLCGCLCGHLRQASYGRSRALRLASVALPAIAAATLTVAVGHYRAAQAAGAIDPAAAVLASLISRPLAPLASLPVIILAIVGAYAFVHMSRAWLRTYGRVPGHRERALLLLNAQEAFAAAVDGAKAAIAGIAEETKGLIRGLLQRAVARRLASSAAAEEIWGIGSRYDGEGETMSKAWAAANGRFAGAASASSGKPWPPRPVPNAWVPPLAVDDPRPIVLEIDRHRKSLEAESAEALQTAERVGAAAIEHVNVLAKAIAGGDEIVADLSKSGPASPRAGFLGREPE